MELEVQLERGRKTPKLVLLAEEMTPQLEELVRCIQGELRDPISGWRGDAVFVLDQWDILRCYAAGQKVFAQTADGEYTLRLRLYELEDRLDPSRFVRISNSEIVNLRAVTALDLSLAGTIRMTLTDGTVSFVSRRYVKRIKQVLVRSGGERHG